MNGWPPLITARRLPWWLLLRDVLLTLLAWGLLAWLLERPLRVSWDWLFVAPFGQLTREAPIDWAALAAMLYPFIVVAAVLVVWVLVWALLRRRPLRALEAQRAPPPLAADEQAAAFGVDAGELQRWQLQQTLTARFDADNRLRAMTADSGPGSGPRSVQ